MMMAVNKDDEAQLRQQMGAALKTAIGKVLESDAAKRYIAEQKRFMDDPTRDGADPCTAR
jgi:hypothetical protein